MYVNYTDLPAEIRLHILVGSPDKPTSPGLFGIPT
jgi:hypothetical protein